MEAELRLRYGVPLTERDKKSLDRYQDRVAKQELQWSAAKTELGNPAVSKLDILGNPSRLYEHDPHEIPEPNHATWPSGGWFDPVTEQPESVRNCEPRSGKDRRVLPTRRRAQTAANEYDSYNRDGSWWQNERGHYPSRRVSPERRAPAAQLKNEGGSYERGVL